MEFIKEFEEAISIWCDGDIQGTIFDSSDEKFYEFVETLSLISKYHFQPNEIVNDNFSFIANSSLSGGTHPCSSLECRKKKLNQLASFASLYADEVYIQNPFESIHLNHHGTFREVERQEVLAGIANYFYLKPIINSGIVKYASLNQNFCTNHSETIAKPLSESIHRKEDRLVEALESYLLKNCEVIYGIKDGVRDHPFFEVRGPEEFIEHGVVYFHPHAPVPSIFENLYGNKLPHVLSTQEVLSSGILDNIIGPIVNDLSAQEWHSTLVGTSYLCDNQAKIKLASKINSKAYSANSSAFENGLKHHLPAIYSNDLSVILDLRNKEEEAFSVYRDNLNKFMKASKSWSDKEVSSVFQDQILPEVNLINKKVKDWKVGVRESISQKLLFGTATASFGLYGGILPANIGEIVAAAGGASAIGTALMDYNKTLKEKNEARKNDFYFLWQAQQ